MSSTPMEAPQTPAGLSQFERVAKTFYEPSATMTDIRRSTSWWLPWLLLSLVSYSLIFAWQQKIGFEKLVQNQIQMNPKVSDALDKLPPDQRAQRLNLQIKITKYASYANPLMMLLSLAVVGAILLAIFNFGLGAKLSYKSSLAITAYSFLPGIVTTILAVSTVYLSDPDGYDMRQPVASNPGALVSMTDHPALATFLSTFDVFMLWTIFLMALGCSRVSDKKIKTSTAFFMVFGCYFVWKLITTGFAAL